MDSPNLSRPCLQPGTGRRAQSCGQSLSQGRKIIGHLLVTKLNRPPYLRIIQRVLALVAALFGVATIVVGVRVLAGSDPGYIVFRPLLLYNTMMGIVYVAAGVIAWRSVDRGKYAAATIFVLNFLVLGAVGYLYAAGSSVAMESLHAMILRTVVWLVLFLGLAWMSHRNYLSDFERDAQPIIPPDASR